MLKQIVKMTSSCLIITLVLGVNMLCSLYFGLVSSAAEVKAEELKGTITISGAWALYPMVIKWSEEFQKIYPQVKIDISAGGAGKGVADALAGVVDLGMVSRDIYPAEKEKGVWWVSVVKDAVVPVMNANNPVAKEILTKGISKEAFIEIWVKGNIENWNQIISLEAKHPLHAYTRSDACGAAQTWAQYLGKNQEDLLGIGVYGDPGLAEAVRNDPMGLGFNNINYVYQAKTREPVNGLQVVPIDLNNNGVLEADENFYHNLDEMVNSIAKGKYPSPPARDLHLASNGRPIRKEVIRFLNFVLSEGQRYVSESGYICLSAEKLQEELKKLGELKKVKGE